MNFNLKSSRHDLLVLRSKHGVHTPIGHRCSTLIEQLQNYEKAEGDVERQGLGRLIRRSLDELGSIQ